jgi:mRNA interferase MazF
LVIARGDIYWVELGDPDGSRPAKRRPVLVVQSASYNTSRLATVVACAISSNTGLATMPGNVFLPAVVTGLQRDSVVNVTALVTLDKDDLGRAVGSVPASLMLDVDQGLRQVLGL